MDQEFPVPQGASQNMRCQPGGAVVTMSQQQFALHHIIRQPDSTFGGTITQFDMLFQLYPDDISDHQVEEYVATVTKAEIMELREAEIVLTTCADSASAKLNNNSNVHQVMIRNISL